MEVVSHAQSDESEADCFVFSCEEKEHNAKQEKRTTRFLSVKILSESLHLVREKINKHLKL